MRSIYFAGLDLGQRQDPTALAVLEWAEYAGAWDAAAFEHRKETSLSLRYLERIQLGTPYPEVVYRVGCMMRSRQLAGGESRHLVMDGTGVGPAVVDLLRREDLQSKLWAVTITGVDTERFADGYLPGTEAGLNCRITGIDAAGRVTDRGGDERGDVSEGDGRDTGQDIGKR